MGWLGNGLVGRLGKGLVGLGAGLWACVRLGLSAGARAGSGGSELVGLNKSGLRVRGEECKIANAANQARVSD